jgi:hypothetical protein
LYFLSRSFAVRERNAGDCEKRPESIATIPPFGPIEGNKWFDKISSQLESRKNRFAFISAKSSFYLPEPADIKKLSLYRAVFFNFFGKEIRGVIE